MALLTAKSKFGENERHFAETRMNHTSSRSHCIFKINVRSRQEGSKNEIVSSINLIDLAGSEGVAKSDINGQRLKEGANINKSLLSVYNVITKLNNKADFVCFRESKLTRILQPYLGGNSLTAIICNIHPLESNYNESVSTLRFAMCAGGVKNNVKINFQPKDNGKLLEEMELEVDQAVTALKMVEEKKIGYSLKISAMQDDIEMNIKFSEANKENIIGLTQKISTLKQECQNKAIQLEKAKEDREKLSGVVVMYEEKFQ